MNDLDDRYTTFVTALERSGLVDQDFLSHLLGDYEAKCIADMTSEEKLNGLVTMLLGRAILTSWQCGKLMLGKFKGFFIENYELRDYLGLHVDDNEVQAFLARDICDETIEVVLEFERFREELAAGREPVYSIKYRRRRTNKPV